MSEETVLTAEAEKPAPEQADDDELTEEEEEVLEEAEEQKKLSRFARGCLEVAAAMLLLAGLLVLLESKAHLCVFYPLPPHVLPLGCMAVSFLSLMVGLFGIGRNAFAMLVMVLSGWMVLFIYSIIYIQEPESICQTIPGTEKSVVMTLVSTPGSATLFIDEPIAENVLSKHWKFPVHGRNIPLGDLIQLKAQESGTVQLIFDGRLWAVYDTEKDSWTDILHHEEDPTEGT